MVSRRLVSVAPIALFLLGAGCGDRRSAALPASPLAAGYEGHLSAGGLAPPGAELRNPHAADKRSAGAGARLFTAMNCDGCHGGGGVGWVGPSLADGRWRYGGTDAALFQSIYYGRPHGMPGFGGILSQDAIWKLVTYLQSLEPPADVPTERWP
jgi:cytochrome c oxidase cbb3-type subunit III